MTVDHSPYRYRAIEAGRLAAKAREATYLRDAAIRELHADGATYRYIAEAVNMSQSSIFRICKVRRK